MNYLAVVIFISFILSAIIAYAFSLFNDKNHLILCELFRKEFDFLPPGIAMAQCGGLAMAFQKDLYFLLPLITKKNTFFVRNMNSEHYDFIKNLPKKMTNWLKIKFTLFLVSILTLSTNIVYFKLTLN